MKQKRTWAFEIPTLIFVIPVLLLEIGCMDIDSSSMSAASDYPDTVGETDAGDDISRVDDSYVPQSSEESLSIEIGAGDEAVDADLCDGETESHYLLGKQTSSAAGAVLARAALKAGAVPTTPIRDLEFVNYYLRDFETKNASDIEPAILANTLKSSALISEDALPLLLSVRAPDVEESVRTPINLVLAVDVSSSMAGAPIDKARIACRTAVEAMGPTDAAVVLEWSTETAPAFGPAIVGNDKSDLIKACNATTVLPDAETDLHVGLTGAYEAADVFADKSRINHILLITDGGSPAGVTDKTLVQTRAADTDVPVFLSVLGVSTEPELYNESLMRMFADAGKGLHFYADTEQESSDITQDFLIKSRSIAATDALFHLTLPPGFLALGTVDIQKDTLLPTPLFSGRSMHFLILPKYCEGSVNVAVESIIFTMEYTLSGESEHSLVSSQLATSNATQIAETANAPETSDIILAYAAALRAMQSESHDLAAEKIETAETLLYSAYTSDTADSSLEEIEEMLAICSTLLE